MMKMSSLGKILKEIDLPDGSGRLALFDWSNSPKSVCENLMLLDREGRIKWRTKLPGIPDFFVHCDLEDGEIFANTFSCYRVRIDKVTGKIVEHTFTK